MFPVGTRCNQSRHSEERSHEESAFAAKKKQIPLPLCGIGMTGGGLSFLLLAKGLCDTRDDMLGSFSTFKRVLPFSRGVIVDKFQSNMINVVLEVVALILSG